jgi:DNA-binding MarR family transcriptional regulator
MSPVKIQVTDRAARIHYVSIELLARVGLLTRLLARHLGGELSRSEAGVLNTLRGGPRRITELAELEGLAQPTTTLLVQRLEQQGLVVRERHTGDGRVVLVDLTDAGRTTITGLFAQASDVLGTLLSELPDEQVEALASATERLALLVDLLQQPTRQAAVTG